MESEDAIRVIQGSARRWMARNEVERRRKEQQRRRKGADADSTNKEEISSSTDERTAPVRCTTPTEVIQSAIRQHQARDAVHERRQQRRKQTAEEATPSEQQPADDGSQKPKKQPAPPSSTKTSQSPKASSTQEPTSHQRASTEPLDKDSQRKKRKKKSQRHSVGRPKPSKSASPMNDADESDDELESSLLPPLRSAKQKKKRPPGASGGALIDLPPLEARYLTTGVKFNAQRDQCRRRKEAAEVKFHLQKMMRDLDRVDERFSFKEERRVEQVATIGTKAHGISRKMRQRWKKEVDALAGARPHRLAPLNPLDDFQH